ncbi:hypothetical protein [Serratia marcescens]|uniref:hypothetical protein n=1 Tax=Serratia marcescens TaxID=615 RepID=UPI00313A92D8
MNVKLTEIKNNGTPWLKIPADGSQIKFTGNADEAAKEFFNALIRVRDGYISALKAERDAQQKRADALAVENAALKAAGNKMFLSAISLMEDPDLKIDHSRDIKDWERNETPATDAAVREIEARGVEKFAEFLDSPIAGQHCYQNEVGLARHFASTLREAK